METTHFDRSTIPLLGDGLTLGQCGTLIVNENTGAEKWVFKKKATAETLIDLYDFITIIETDEILVRDHEHGYYRDKGELTIKQELSRIIDNHGEQISSITVTNINWILEEIRNRTYKDKEVFEEHKASFWINVKNCWLNLQTREYWTHNLTPQKMEELHPEKTFEEIAEIMRNYREFIRTHFFRTKIPIIYDPIKTCPNFLIFLAQVLPEDVGNNNNFLTLQEELGYGLYPLMPIQQAVVLVGEGGNGKSVCQNIFRKFFGNQNVTGVQIHELVTNEYKPAELYMKRMNIQHDVSPKSLKNVQIFQRLVGGDFFTANRKYMQPFDFVNTAKVLLSCNRPPKVADYDRTYAFFRRWVLVQFLRRFTGTEKRDPDEIINECTTDDELSGMLNFALEGLQRLLFHGHFSNNPDVESLEKKWIQLSDPAEWFATELVESDLETGMLIETNLLYGFFEKLCKDKGLTKLSKTYLSRMLNEHAEIKSFSTTQDGIRIRKYRGVAFLGGYEQEFLDWSGQTQPIIEAERTEQRVSGTNPFLRNLTVRDTMISALRELRRDLASDEHIKKGELFKRLEFLGKTTEELQEVLEELSQDGTIYEPKPDYYNLTRE